MAVLEQAFPGWGLKELIFYKIHIQRNVNVDFNVAQYTSFGKLIKPQFFIWTPANLRSQRPTANVDHIIFV